MKQQVVEFLKRDQNGDIALKKNPVNMKGMRPLCAGLGEGLDHKDLLYATLPYIFA